MHDGNFEDAEEAAIKLLLVMNFVELAGATPINEQQDSRMFTGRQLSTGNASFDGCINYGK